MANLGNTIINGMLRVNGKLSVSDAITAPSFEGALTGNASSATQVKTTQTNPTTTSWYAIPFHNDVTTGNRDLRNNNGLLYGSLEGTTSAVGVSTLTIGNDTASGTAANKKGRFQIYSEGAGCVFLQAATTSTNYTATLPAATGTIALTSSNVASATKATQDGSGNVITSTYLKTTGGTVTNANYSAFTLQRQDTGSGSGITYSNTSGTLATMGFNGDGTFCMTKGGGTLGTADMLKITNTGIMTTYGNITPSVNNAASIGSSSMKYANVYATTFTGALSGNASTASKAAQLTTARNINGVSFNGTADISINKLVCIDVTGQTIDWDTYNYANGYTEGIWNSKTDGGASAFTNLAVTGKSCRIELKLCRFNNTTDYIQMQEQWVGTDKKLYRRYNVSGTWSSWVTVSTNGVAASATKLATARTIGVSGVTGTAQSFDGSQNIVIPITAVPASLVTGTVAAATKATQDGSGNTITSTYCVTHSGTATPASTLGKNGDIYVLLES